MSVYPHSGVQPGYSAQPQINIHTGYAPPPPQQTNVVVLHQPTSHKPGTCRGCGRTPESSYIATMSSYPQYQQGSPPGYQSTSSTNVVVVQQPGTVITGGCRACGGGVLEDSFTVCGICLAIWFFPIGILCCFLLMEKRCSNCGVVYS